MSELIETTPAAWRYTTMLAACTQLQDYRRKSGDVDRGEPRAFHSLCDESLGATRAEHSFNNRMRPMHRCLRARHALRQHRIRVR